MLRIKIASFSLFCVVVSCAHATTWVDLKSDEKGTTRTASFWDPSKTSSYNGEFLPQDELSKNLEKRSHLMRLDHQNEDIELTLHKLYTYSASDFSLYKKKVPEYAEEQLELGRWINQQAKENLKDPTFITKVDKFYHRLEEVAPNESWLQTLEQELLSIRLGVPTDVFSDYPDLEQFVSRNFLYKHLPYHKHQIEIDANGSPSLLVEGKMVPWTDLKEKLKIDHNGVMTNYFYTYQGLTAGRPDEVILPFKKVNPRPYHHRHILEIASIDVFPPHNWIRLIDSEGLEYSIGYWSSIPLTNMWAAIQNILPKEGRVMSPDLMEFVADPNKTVVTAIEISQEQFDQVLTYLQEYQKDPKKYEILSTLGGENCATFVRQIMDRLGLKIQTHSWIRPFNNPYDILDWQAKIKDWRLEQLDAVSNPTPEQRFEIEYGLPK